MQVYTLFKNVKDRPVEPPVEPRLDALNFPKIYPNSESLEAIGLMPKKIGIAVVEHWEPTEALHSSNWIGSYKSESLFTTVNVTFRSGWNFVPLSLSSFGQIRYDDYS